MSHQYGAGILLLPVAVGCAYNGCLLCTFFRHLACRGIFMEQIEEKLSREAVYSNINDLPENCCPMDL